MEFYMLFSISDPQKKFSASKLDSSFPMYLNSGENHSPFFSLSAVY